MSRPLAVSRAPSSAVERRPVRGMRTLDARAPESLVRDVRREAEGADGIEPAPFFRWLERALGGRYRIVQLLGRGAASEVYLAWEPALERHVAIKVLPPEYAAQLETRERFRREARTTASLAHPNIVPVHAFGEADGMLYFVMGHVRGESLAERLRRERRLAVGETCRMLGELADALDFAHQCGVVHRDVKPENILLDEATGRPVLLDFGVATVRTSDHSRAEVSKAFGTPHYMSPEQVLREPDFDGRSDLYALGVVGYRMLTGRLPFDTSCEVTLAAQHVATDPPPIEVFRPDVPPHVAGAIRLCLAKDPVNRWPDGRSLKAALANGAPPQAPTRRGLLRRLAERWFGAEL